MPVTGKKTPWLRNVHIAAAIIVAFVVVVLIQSGLFDKVPTVGVVADNCYEETLHVITDEDYSPYSFYDENGQFSGYDVEMITRIANILHMNLDLRFMSWNEGIAAMAAGEADVLMTCDFSDSFEGVDKLIKSESTSSDDFIVYANHPIKSISAMYGKRIAIMKNGNVTPQMALLGLSKDCIKYDDNRKAMQALMEGEVDFAVMRQAVGVTLLRELKPSKAMKAYLSAGTSYMCFGINVDKPELVDKINGAIEELKISGECDRMKDKWLTTFVRPYTFFEILAQNLWLVFLVFLIIIFAIVYYFRTKQRELKEREGYERKLEAANKSKTDFLFNMSHDIRTPMNAIIGFTQLAKKNIDNKDRVADSLTKIENSGNHLLDLINEVLDMSRVEAGKLRSEMKTVSVTEEAMRLVDICRESAKHHNVDLELIEKNIIHKTVLADELHINQIIMNILGNAVKYSKPGGKITYTIEEEVSDIPGYGSYIFTIQDDGIGMSKEFLERIYDSFSREENASTSAIQGTGLGMAIVKRLVDYMNGTIDVESEQGTGTTVTVKLHLILDDSALDQDKNEEEIAVNLAGKKVLLVEDNELNREIAEMILSEQEMIVDKAVNGVDAVEHVKAQGVDFYDLVLMDVQMPIMDGFEATKEIRKLPGSERLPIIALSANAFEEDKMRSIEAGMNDHVAKPIELSELMRAMAKYV